MQVNKSKLEQAIRAIREDFYNRVKVALEQHSELTYAQIGEQIGVSEATVLRVAQRYQISRPVGPRPQGTKEERQ